MEVEYIALDASGNEYGEGDPSLGYHAAHAASATISNSGVLNNIYFDDEFGEVEDDWERDEPSFSLPDPGDKLALFLVIAPLTLILLFIAILIPLYTGVQLNAFSSTINQNEGNVSHSVAPGAGNYERGAISPIFSPEVQYWEGHILKWASIHKLDPNIIATIMQVESCGDFQANSSAGAQGLFQVMPFHFETQENMLDPDINAARGLSYYNERLEQTNGNRALAFAGYNGGHVAAASGYNSWANETQRYYEWTTGIMSDIEAGYTESPTLQRWMNAGGAGLCRQAAQQLGLIH